MAFFLSNLVYPNVVVCGVRDGVTNAGKPFSTVTVVDPDGNTNSLSTSESDTMQLLHSLQPGTVVDLRVVCAGGPRKQYAMISRGAGSVVVHDDNPGY